MTFYILISETSFFFRGAASGEGQSRFPIAIGQEGC